MNPDIPQTFGIQDYLTRKNERIERVGEYLTNSLLSNDLLKNREIILEIGCGHGHWLSSFASINQDKLFIGIDLITKRIEKCNKKKHSLGLTNLFFIKAEALEFLSAFPKELQIQSTFFMFPDPWPKKRHFKNRLIQHHLLQKLACCSTSKSKIYFRSDHFGYFNWTLDILKSNENWQVVDEDWPHESGSFFQDLFDNSFTCTAQIS